MRISFLSIIFILTTLNSTAAILPNNIVPPCTLYNFLDDCDACGCSASGGSLGFSSMINPNFIGVRYLYQSYRSRDGVFNDSPWIKEQFNTAQLWARIPLSSKVEVTALIPYHFHRRVRTDQTQNINGIGDITILGFYTIFQTKTDTVAYQHKVQIGGGIKAPTGSYDRTNNGSVNPSFQVGTGSWDYTLATEYTVKKDRWGANITANYIFKTENDKQYQFGNQLNYATTLFYTASANMATIVPNIGFAGEVYSANKDYDEDVRLTKGDILFGKAGVELGYNKFSFGVNAMVPLSQNLVGNRVEANYRLAFNLNYSL